MQEAHSSASASPTTMCVNYLQTGPTGEVLFPNGKFIGDRPYAQLIYDRLNMSVTDFEDGIKDDITARRLQALITAGVTVSDQEVREAYRKQNIKIKFDYAVISSDDLRKTINPSDSDLEAFFKKNAARYAQAVPEERTIAFFAFTANQIPGGVPKPSQQADSAVLQRAPERLFGAGAGQVAPYSHQRARRRRRQDRRSGQGQGRDGSEAAASGRKLDRRWPRNTLTIRAARTPAASWALRSAARWCRSSTRPSSRRRSATSRS